MENRITSAGTDAQQGTTVDVTMSSQTIAKPNVGSSAFVEEPICNK